MRAFHEIESPGTIIGSYHQSLQKLGHCCSFRFPLTDMSAHKFSTPETTLSFEACNGQFYTLESSADIPYSNNPVQDSSSSVSRHFSDYDSPRSVSSFASSMNLCTSGDCLSISRGVRRNLNTQVIPAFDLKQGLIACARSLSDSDISTAISIMGIIEKMVSISGDPIQRLGAYLLEGLRARIESSGNLIYKKLQCDEPTGPELMTSMQALYQICPYWKFAYTSANSVIQEAVKNEPMIHIIDFQIAQGGQWVPFIKSISSWREKPLKIRITGIDDSQSAIARGGGLEIIGQRLSIVAEMCDIPFEFHGVSMMDHEVRLEHLRVLPGEAVVVNLPYVLHHVPDESVSTENYRDRLLRLVRGLSPRVVTLTEQESNTNTSPFYTRFLETLDYYNAMFESIDVARPRGELQRIKAEQNCVARDIVNMVACEGPERVERHELLGKWRLRFSMAGFRQSRLNRSVTDNVLDMLRGEYSHEYQIEEKDGAVYLHWRKRAMVTFSAWR
ncbi:hypothetical protein SAY87_021175 [Trapa incisa]|uniref:Scarecrow-like protein 13 n=1 Tax=Trapa incisa TaxID=236973 RepID=A0AAN7JSW0_9MYRT|nr:hypothetical protein SAY87_021175 [Trapa incisa]